MTIQIRESTIIIYVGIIDKEIRERTKSAEKPVNSIYKNILFPVMTY